MRVLFVTFAAGGNLPPALGIAQRVLANGGEALLLGDAGQAAASEAAGVPHTPHSTAVPFAPLERTSIPRGIVRLTRTTCGPAVADDLLRVAADRRPDVVVVDCMLLAALAASIRAGYPTVTLVHSFPSYFAQAYGRGPIGLVATACGQPPARRWRAAQASIATALPSLEGSGARSPFAALHLVGPVTPAVAQSSRASSPRRRPRVLISLSTIWYPGQDRTLQKLLDAVDGLDLDVVMTTGHAIDPAALRAPANAEVVRYVDHDALLHTVDAVVGHGGHGTAMRALAHDLPMLVVPSFSMTDQPEVGRRIAAAGAGSTLPPSASATRLRETIAWIARPGPHRVAAARLGRELRALDPAGAAVEVLAAVGATREGLARR